MKKIMMMALMAAAATTAFAQDALIKEAKKAFSKGEFDQAVEILTPALTSSETVDKAAAWNLQTDIMFGKFSAIQEENMKNQVAQKKVAFDTLGMNNACYEALKAAIECDKYDVQPNGKGKVKIRFRQNNQQRMMNVRLNLINAGLFDYNHKDLDGALAKWSLYIDSPENPLFTGFVDVADLSKDQYRSEIAYYAGLVAYQKKDFVVAEKYAHIAAQDPKKASEANEILLFSKKETMKTKADSLAYVDMLKDFHKQKPEEERYFNLLMDYYTHTHDMEAMKTWADEEIAMNEENKKAWALKGQVLMNTNKFDEAIECYKKAIELDPDYLECVFNIGVCYNSKAIALNDQLMDKKTMRLSKENDNKVKEVLKEELTFMERARELDPNREKVNWAYPLYRIYYTMQNKEKMAELEAIDPSLK